MELLQLRDIKKHFSSGKKRVHAVDGVSLSIQKGQTFGLVGESGCGKSTTGRLILGLNPLTEGSIHFEGKNIHQMTRDQKFHYRRHVQMIFQDPYASLNPRMNVLDLIAEGLEVHGMSNRAQRREKVFDLMEKVGLQKEHATRFAHEFSGGQRQRIGIARALAVSPDLVIADEPISALDVSIQAQVMLLLQSLQAELNLTYLFISHDLTMVQYISDFVGVMYLGKLVEYGTCDEIYHHPQHPYTKALLSAVPQIGENKNRIRLIGDLPSPTDLPKGCRFQTRCPFTMERCKQEEPVLKGTEQHLIACHL